MEIIIAQKSSGLLKKLIVVGLLLGLVAGGVLIAAPFFINWDSIKDQATAALSKNLKREVSVGDVEVGLFIGVKLKDVRVANGKGYSKDALFFNKTASVELSIMSLFSGKIVLTRIRFDQPTIVIEKDARGRYNFSDMVSQEPAARPGAQAGTAGGEAQSLPVVIAALEINKANFTYRDLGAKTEQGFKDLNLKLTGFSLQGAGKSQLEVDMVGHIEGKDIPVNFRLFFKLDPRAQTLALHDWTLAMPSITAAGSGMITGLDGQPSVNLKNKITVKLASLAGDLLPLSALKDYPPGMKLEGVVTVDIDMKGSADHPYESDFAMRVALDKVGVRWGDYPALTDLGGQLALGKNSFNIKKLDMMVAGSPVSVALNSTYDIKNLLGPKEKLKVAVAYSVRSPRLVLDPFMALVEENTPEQLAAAEKIAAAEAKKPPIDFRPLIPAGLSIKGIVQVDAMQLKKINIGKTTHEFSLKNRQAVSEAKSEMFDGTVYKLVKADLNKPGAEYTIDYRLSRVNMGPLVDAAVASYPEALENFKFVKDIQGKVTGHSSFTMKGKGRDTRPVHLKKNLDVAGAFKIEKGWLKKIDAQEKIAKVIPHPATQELIRRDLGFDYLGGTYRIQNNKVTWSNTEMYTGKDKRQGDLYIESSGAHVLDGAIDAKVTTHFNPRAAKLGGELAKAFNDDKGWTTYAMGYKGATLETAKADFTAGLKKAQDQYIKTKTDEVKKQAETAVKKEAQKVIEKQGQDLIKKLPGGLKGLFGK